MKPDLSVFLMAFNEADAVEETAGEIHRELVMLGVPFELVIIDDGSSDGTAQKADSLAALLADTRVIHHRQNLGLGGVYRTGFSEAKGDYITFFPADGQFPADIIGIFLKAITDCDMVLGYIPSRKSPVVAKALSALERIVYACLFGPMPKFQGIMIFRRSLLGDFMLKSSGRGWAVLMELIIRAKKKGRKIVSVPTQMRPRMKGVSKVNNFTTIWVNLEQVIRLRGLL